MWEVEFYETANSIVPVKEFLEGLNKRMRSKALHEIMLLKEFGMNLREPYSKAMGKGIFELRIQMEGDISRIFYFFAVGKRIVLTNGFIKKTQKTPRAEIKKAEKFKQDFERRRYDE